MKKLLNSCLVFLLMIVISQLAIAQDSTVTTAAFNAEKAGAQLIKFNKKLIRTDLTLSDLNVLTGELEALQGQANSCVTTTQEQLKIVNSMLKSIKADQLVEVEQADYKYLQDKRLLYAKQLSECRVFVYRSEETLTKLKDSMQKLSTDEILTRSTPVWQIDIDRITLSLGNIDFNKIIADSGIKEFTLSLSIVGLLLVCFGVFVARIIKKGCERWITLQTYRNAIYILVNILSDFIVPIMFFAIVSVFLHLLYNGIIPVPTLELLGYTGLIFTLFVALSKYLFSPAYNLNSPIGIKPSLGLSFHKRFVILLIVAVLGYVAVMLFGDQPFQTQFIYVTRALYITILSGLLIWFVWLVTRTHHFKEFTPSSRLLVKVVLLGILAAIIVAEWSGFHRLVVFIINGVIFTTLLLGVVIGLWQLIKALYQYVDNNNYAVARHIRKTFDVKPHRKLNEIIIIKFSLYFIVLCFFAIAFLKGWSVSENIIDAFMDGLVSGFNIAELTIVPSRIITGFVSFALLMLAGRFIAASVAKHKQFKGEADTQVAIASIINYCAFAIAVLLALVIIGVNFTGLAIIAGALSVGIGLGLQTIVNNFFSGLILLLEKPIKPGDRIIVGDTEGFVKKIRIRSTQITTLAKEDVIVPNADLIANQVTNYMFRDRNWRVVIPVGVAYGSDTDLVRQVLLELASKHPDVVQTPPNIPAVLFRNFGDSSLEFELWCIIHDVNKKFVIASDLNFAIDQAFREHDITIAFPQRDVHIKEYHPIKPPADE